MPSLTVELPDHLARLVKDAVARGDYESPSAAVADALCILQYEAETHGEKLATLRREVRRGAIEVDAGQFSDRTIQDIGREVLAEAERMA